MEISKRLRKYIFTNVFAMLGMSLYILADTFFISLANGGDGLTALNLTLPIYSLVYAIGAMIGVGSAIRFALYVSNKQDRAKDYFSNAILWCLSIGILVIIIFWFYSKEIMSFLGADDTIGPLAISYIKCAMIFAPFFMMNFSFVSFVRNDNDPSLAMIATIVSSLTNIVLDYVFMFPLGLGMVGAALATGVSPIVSISICSFHFRKKNNRIHFRLMIPSINKLIEVSKLGISAFVGEISGGITTLSFNYILLALGGNIYVAAYGIISNVAIVATAIFNGVAQGLQPLTSEYYGSGAHDKVEIVLKRSLKISLVLAFIIIILIYLFSDIIVQIFNSDQSLILSNIANRGLKLYFIGYIFASLNIINASYYSAKAEIKRASLISILRGVILIVISAYIISKLFGIDMIWISFLLAEFITYLINILVDKLNLMAY